VLYARASDRLRTADHSSALSLDRDGADTKPNCCAAQTKIAEAKIRKTLLKKKAKEKNLRQSQTKRLRRRWWWRWERIASRRCTGAHYQTDVCIF
jgi:hypothetical protein